MVYFDATGTTDTPDTTKPIHHLTYCFDGGDDSGETYSLSGLRTTSADTFCGAPGWAKVYETPGTYTATLTVNAEDGDQATDSVSVTITDWTAADTTCVSTSGTFTGCPAGSTETTSSDFDAEATTDARVLYRCGESFAASARVSVDTGDMIGAFDSSGVVTGTRCRFTITGSGWAENHLFDQNSDDSVRITGFYWAGSTTKDLTSGGGGDSDWLLIKNVELDDIRKFMNDTVPSGANISTGWGIFSSSTDSLNLNVGFFTTANEYLALVGNYWDTGSGNPQYHFRIQSTDNLVVHGNRYRGTTSTHVVTHRGQADVGNDAYAEKHFMSDNWFESDRAQGIQTGGVGGEGCPGIRAEMRDLIYERNYLTQPASRTEAISPWFERGATNSCSGAGSENDVTIRNNWADIENGPTSGGLFISGTMDSGLEIYGNSIYVPSAHSIQFLNSGIASACDVAENNILWDDDNSATFYVGSACTASNTNYDADGGETGVLDLAACPFATCPPTSALADWTLDTGNNCGSGRCENAGTGGPNMVDATQTCRDYISPAVGAVEGKRTGAGCP